MNERRKDDKIRRLSEWLIIASSGFNIQEDLIKSIHSQLDQLMNGSEGNMETNSNKPYWMVEELDRVALSKAKAELQKVADSRGG